MTRMSHNTLHLLAGCSGFSYKEWKGEFYPKDVPASQWFEYYCTRFPTLELNVTFYRFPTLENLKGWYKRSPPSFVFAVKAPRLITHLKQFNDTSSLQQDFYTLIGEGLAEKLGPVLYQLPARLTYSRLTLDRILASMDKRFVNVVEFRDQSWWREDVRLALQEKDVIFCSVSYPGLPDKVMTDSSTVYYRFHGVPSLYRSPYSSADLEKVIRQVKEANSVHKAYFYFNNTAEGAAVHNALEVAAIAKSLYPRG
jgi:uncharacterized protein YecE (DUF72 family)